MRSLQRIIDLFTIEPFSQVITTVIIIVSLWLINLIIKSIIEKKVSDLKSSYSWRKTVSYTLVFIGLFLIGRVWFEGVQSLATFLGLLSAGLAIALKDFIASFVGWMFIVWRKPFQVGNRIQIGTLSGDVIDLRPFQFTLLEIGNWVKADQSTGRIVHVPNNLIFVDHLVNYDAGFRYIWNEIPVMITFESNWQKAKQKLQEIADKNGLQLTGEAEEQIKQTARKFLIFYNKLTPIVYTSVEDSGILLTIRYLTDIRKRRGTTEAMWEDILKTFTEHSDIDLAYPTQRIIR